MILKINIYSAYRLTTSSQWVPAKIEIKLLNVTDESNVKPCYRFFQECVLSSF